jgi:transcription elongation factor GreB
MSVVDRPPDDRHRVFFGAWVTLEDESGHTTTHRIVGPDEFDLAPGYISMDAPLGRALLGKRLDDEVTVSTPAGQRTWLVAEIRYT